MSFDISQFLKNVEGEAKRRAIKAGATAVEQFAEHVIGKAQKLAPISPSSQYMPGIRKAQILNPRYTGHSGALKESSVVESAQVRGTKITVQVGFNTEYAAANHERLDYHHDQGQAKYLEKPMREQAHKLSAFVEKQMKKAL